MKKLSQRDFILLTVLAGFIFLYLLFIYFYEPYEKKLNEAKEIEENLEFQMDSNYMTKLEKELNDLQMNLSLTKEEKKESDTVKTITKKEQENILLNIGKNANVLDINLVKFEEKPVVKSFEYNIIPYSIKARGDNASLVLLLNKLYEEYNYFYINEVQMRKVKVVSEFERPTDEINIEDSAADSWSNDFLDLVQMDFPRHLLQNDQPATNEEQNKENKTKTAPLNSELQLDFILYFVTKNE